MIFSFKETPLQEDTIRISDRTRIRAKIVVCLCIVYHRHIFFFASHCVFRMLPILLRASSGSENINTLFFRSVYYMTISGYFLVAVWLLYFDRIGAVVVVAAAVVPSDTDC